MANQQGDLGAAFEPVVRDAVAAAGFELEHLEIQRVGRRSLVKVVVDTADGIELDQVAAASRAVADALDEHDDKFADPYTLEVTSPGLDRPLTKPRHWRKARLRLVKVRQAGGESFIGRVGDVADDGVQLLVQGALRRVEFAGVEHAVIEIEFSQPPPAELDLLGGSSEEGSR